MLWAEKGGDLTPVFTSALWLLQVGILPKVRQGKGGTGSRKIPEEAISIILVRDRRTWTRIKTVREINADSVHILRIC